jgi:hypothetical protein
MAQRRLRSIEDSIRGTESIHDGDGDLGTTTVGS